MRRAKGIRDYEDSMSQWMAFSKTHLQSSTSTLKSAPRSFSHDIAPGLGRQHVEQHHGTCSQRGVRHRAFQQGPRSLQLHRTERRTTKRNHAALGAELCRRASKWYVDCFDFSISRVNNAIFRFSEETAVVKMLPSFIRATSVSKESGEFLALDLGGSNFRVLLITLHGDGKKGEMRHVTYAVPQELQQGTGEHLFDHVADCLHNFMVAERLSCNKTLPLGFTFSFPCQQRGLASASLVAWTKGFSASGVVGKDVVQLLTDACRRKNIAVNVVALVNDTVGTMLACSFFDPDCSIGLIVGTGSNACYMERLQNITKLN
uniref:Phosphotransferase n=1 Tax=Meloidogyne javanica TaxID=6303 RepID=A0A915MZR7_MELJA